MILNGIISIFFFLSFFLEERRKYFDRIELIANRRMIRTQSALLITSWVRTGEQMDVASSISETRIPVNPVTRIRTCDARAYYERPTIIQDLAWPEKDCSAISVRQEAVMADSGRGSLLWRTEVVTHKRWAVYVCGYAWGNLCVRYSLHTPQRPKSSIPVKRLTRITAGRRRRWLAGSTRRRWRG